MIENNKEKKFVCRFNEKHVLKSKNGKTVHEIWCPDNPNKEQANNIRKKFQGERSKGENAPMYGKHQTEETKQLIREKCLKYYEQHPGCNLGENAPMYGKYQTEETKQLMREKRLKYIKEHPGCNLGENAPNFGNRNENTLVWNDWIYNTLHYTIRRLKLKQKKCEICNKKTTKLYCSYNFPHWNANPLYYSLNIDHYTWRCASCHQKHDKILAFWAKWDEKQIQEYTKNLKILKKNWPHRIEKKFLKKYI